MKKTVLYLVAITILATVMAYGVGFFFVSVAPHNSYRLNETEVILINAAIERFRERLENNKLDEIREDLSQGRRDEYWEKIIVEDLRKDQLEFGVARSWELFRCAQPQFDRELNETIYHLDYLTRFDSGEASESFILVKKADNQINLINRDINLAEVAEWQIDERNIHDTLVGKYPNEIIIPYADRYIEFRY
ncbi:MAG: hypothetical protein ABI857_05145 [Acidobacteriota bacterium]